MFLLIKILTFLHSFILNNIASNPKIHLNPKVSHRLWNKMGCLPTHWAVKENGEESA